MKECNKLNINVGEQFIQEWKPLVNFKNIIDNIYEVSNDGLVRVIDTKEERHRKVATKKNHPYYAVSLKNKNNKLEWVLVHQLVAYCFLPVPDELQELRDTINLVVDHRDNNGLNNLYTNLSWESRGRNVALSKERNDCIHNGNYENMKFDKLDSVCNGLTTCDPFKSILDKTGLKYNEVNVRMLRNISRKKFNSNRCYGMYNFTVKNLNEADERLKNPSFSMLHEILTAFENDVPFNNILESLNIDVNLENLKRLEDIYNLKYDSNISYDDYDFYTNTRSTSLNQSEIVNELPTIRNMIAIGKTNGEIVDELWPGLKKSTRKSRVRTVHRIRTGQLYKNT